MVIIKVLEGIDIFEKSTLALENVEINTKFELKVMV